MRVLAPSEQRFVRHGTYTGRSVSVTGVLDVAALREAFAALQVAFPVIVCRIAEDGDGTGYLLPPGDSRDEASVREGDAETVGLPGTPVSPGTQLAYLDAVVSGADRWRVTLYAHHSVADAGHCVELLSRFWGFYTDIVEATPISVVPQGYPQSLEWYVAERGITAGPVSGFEDVTRPLVAAPVSVGDSGPSALARPSRTRLDRAATARIIELGRHRGVSVNGLVTAALLRAYASETAGGPVHLGCLYPVDMRPRLDPPVAPAEGTNMAGLASFAAEIDPSASVLELAQRVSERLRHDLADGVVQQSVLHFPDFFGDSRIHSLAGHVAITNTGAVPSFRTPAGLTLTDYEIVYLSAHPRPSAGASAAVTFLVYTFDGRLAVGVLGADAERLLGAVHSELTALSAAERPTGS
ncbi:phthiocerol/phthiodiolone dimycocerosyl transferase-like enzyme [Nocardia tenerifensis]|uniref:Phthiocerol/phthiodiolone dimycocerosyl transferase n=1 Tax=Nocardia tenerifensis TaxID=228006 RepID=A0A318KI45_9NOCA|nr:phthiocerol/phthiodiolone dimycocerosyl transferase-like enzyme [Nocardia tenerifensis]